LLTSPSSLTLARSSAPVSMVSKMQLLHNHAQRADQASPLLSELFDE